MTKSSKFLCAMYTKKNKFVKCFWLFCLWRKLLVNQWKGQIMLKLYKGKGINILDCQGQCYDVAPNVQSIKKRAVSYILKESPKAYTTSWLLLSLNLSLASTCKILIITNVIEIYRWSEKVISYV